MSQKTNWITNWVKDSDRIILDSSFMKMVERTCHLNSAPSSKHKFYLFESKDWCNIIPVTEDGKIVMVDQYRIGADQRCLEIPGGVVDAQDTDLAATAIRELVEETGYEPLPGARCEKLSTYLPNPAIQNNRVHNFVVGPVRKTKGQTLDLAEEIQVREVTIEELPSLLTEGAIDHALIVLGFFQLMLKREGGSEHLTGALRAFVKA